VIKYEVVQNVKICELLFFTVQKVASSSF